MLGATCLAWCWMAWMGGAYNITRLFSSISPMYTLAQLLLYPILKALRGLRKARAYRWGCKASAVVTAPCPSAEGMSADQLLVVSNEWGLLRHTLGFAPSGKALVWASFYLMLYFWRTLLKQIPYPSSPQKYCYFLFFVLSSCCHHRWFIFCYILFLQLKDIRSIFNFFSIGKQLVPKNSKPFSSLAVKQRERPWIPSENCPDCRANLEGGGSKDSAVQKCSSSPLKRSCRLKLYLLNLSELTLD